MGDEVEMSENEKGKEAEEKEEVKQKKRQLTYQGQGTRWGRQKLPGKAMAALEVGVLKMDWFTTNIGMLKKYKPRNTVAGWETMNMEERVGPTGDEGNCNKN